MVEYHTERILGREAKEGDVFIGVIGMNVPQLKHLYHF
jgi:hypothetical protein